MQNHVEREQPKEAVQDQRHAEDHKKPEKDAVPRHGKGGQGQQGVVGPADDYGQVPGRAAHDFGMENQGGDEAGGRKERKLPGGTPASGGIDQHHDGSDEPSGEPEPEAGDEEDFGRRGLGGRGANKRTAAAAAFHRFIPLRATTMWTILHPGSPVE